MHDLNVEGQWPCFRQPTGERAALRRAPGPSPRQPAASVAGPTRPLMGPPPLQGDPWTPSQADMQGRWYIHENGSSNKLGGNDGGMIQHPPPKCKPPSG